MAYHVTFGSEPIKDDLRFEQDRTLEIDAHTVTFTGRRRFLPWYVFYVAVFAFLLTNGFASYLTRFMGETSAGLLLDMLAIWYIVCLILALPRSATRRFPESTISRITTDGRQVSWNATDTRGKRAMVRFRAQSLPDARDIVDTLENTRTLPNGELRPFLHGLWRDGFGFYGSGHVALDGGQLNVTGRRGRVPTDRQRASKLTVWLATFSFAAGIALYIVGSDLLGKGVGDRHLGDLFAFIILVLLLLGLLGVRALLNPPQTLAWKSDDLTDLLRSGRELSFKAPNEEGVPTRSVFYTATVDEARAIELALVRAVILE